jgi:hypothetical protein
MQFGRTIRFGRSVADSEVEILSHWVACPQRAELVSHPSSHMSGSGVVIPVCKRTNEPKNLSFLHPGRRSGLAWLIRNRIGTSENIVGRGGGGVTVTCGDREGKKQSSGSTAWCRGGVALQGNVVFDLRTVQGRVDSVDGGSSQSLRPCRCLTFRIGRRPF